MKNNRHYRILCLALSTVFVGALACATVDSNRHPEEFDPIRSNPMEEAMFEDMADTVAPTNIGESMLEKLKEQDGVPTEHMVDKKK